MEFTKMQGTGNDYVYVDCFKETVRDPAKTAIYVSDRHFGIGSDGLILICPSRTADCRMEMYNVGNPHAIYYVDQVDCLDLERIGPAFENHERFAPDRVNTEFIHVADRKHLEMRVWERGSGETWACGTGATASVMASILMGYTEDEAEVALRGGKLVIRYERESGHLFMTGPAVEVFRGSIDIPEEIYYD